MTDLLRYRLLRCIGCGNRTWTTEDHTPRCICGRRNWWEDHTFTARNEGPGLAPTQVRWTA